MRFSDAVKNSKTPSARTTNGMAAFSSTGSSVLDLFSKAGSARGTDILPLFEAAYNEDPDLATRTSLWLRDIREGAGERKLFINILNWMEKKDPDRASKMLLRIPELGRWKDIFEIEDESLRYQGYALIKKGLFSEEYKNARGLVAKWCPRKGLLAVELRNFLGMSPKAYRKMLVSMTDVVETKMCAKQWDEIDFNKVPSLAASRYKKAFSKNAPTSFAAYVAKLVSTDPKVRAEVKVNAGAVYPYDILKGIAFRNTSWSKTQRDHIIAQWEALPNFIGDASILPLIDVSGSMSAIVANDIRAIDIAVSLGLYMADKNTGVFKDTFLTFSTKSEICHLTGNILDKLSKMMGTHWDMSTNLHSAFEAILDLAKSHGVDAEEMPKTILVLSDMQFNACIRYDDTAIDMIRRKYESAGYMIPNVIFWNLNAVYKNSPATRNERGVALVSGFSPSMLKNLQKIADYTPEKAMKETLLSSRYDY